jgi:hypothetical protein
VAGKFNEFRLDRLKDIVSYIRVYSAFSGAAGCVRVCVCESE